MELFDADLLAFADDWRLADQAERTVAEYVDCLRKYNQWCTAKGLQTLTMRAVESYLVEVRERSPWKAYMVSRAMKAYGRWYAVEYEQQPKARRGRPQSGDPFGDLDFVVQPKERPQRTTTVADVAALRLVCGDDIRGRRDRALIHVLASSGMRRTEVASMKWGHLDLATGIVTVPVTKNGHPRIVRLDKDAQRAVRRYAHALNAWEFETDREPAEYIWLSTTRRTNLTSNGMGQMLRERSQEAGVDVSAHAFRRGFAVQWLRKGGSESYLRQVAGWKSPRMVAAYVAKVAQEEALVEHERLFG